MSYRDEMYHVENIVNDNVISLYGEEGGQKVQTPSYKIDKY